MSYFGIILILIIGGVWIASSVAMMFSRGEKIGWRRWLARLGGVLMLVGAVGFFGAALSASGGLNWLPDSFEWPVGYASGVVQLDDQLYVVPLTASGRVQIYDSEWRFVRGRGIDGGGGSFKLIATGPSQFDVITARGDKHLVYDTSGKLLSSKNYLPASYSSFPDQGKSYFVPTAPWLWVFSNPFYSWGCAMAGMLSLAVGQRYGEQRNVGARTKLQGG
jgi:hypothetical protein